MVQDAGKEIEGSSTVMKLSIVMNVRIMILKGEMSRVELYPTGEQAFETGSIRIQSSSSFQLISGI